MKKTNKIVYPKVSELDECPQCGHDIFYLKQEHRGRGSFFVRFDGKQVSNEDLYAYVTSTSSKYAYCQNCKNRIALNDIDREI